MIFYEKAGDLMAACNRTDFETQGNMKGNRDTVPSG